MMEVHNTSPVVANFGISLSFFIWLLMVLDTVVIFYSCWREMIIKVWLPPKKKTVRMRLLTTTGCGGGSSCKDG
jgi:hypothetical protein